jgi:hypothetical protein
MKERERDGELHGLPEGAFPGGRKRRLPRTDHRPQHRVDQPRRLLPPDAFHRGDGLEDRHALGDARVQQLVGPQPQGVSHQGIGLFQRTGQMGGKGGIEGAAPPQRPHHQLGQQRPVAGFGEAAFAQRPIEENVGVRPPPVHAGEDRKRRLPYRDSRSPFFTRRPWA